MPESPAKPTPFDPYKNFKFRIRWDGRYVAGVSKVGLKRANEPPGRTEYEPVTLERGITHDTEFERWANTFGSGLEAEVPQDFRKDITIEVYNEAGQFAFAYRVFRCWASEFQSLPDLDANANAVKIQSLKLENEGWERDHEVTEQTEPPSPSR